MHGLDVIISKNLKAAGREAAHAVNDGDTALANKIAEDVADDIALMNWSKTFIAAYWRARKEG